MPTHEPHPVVIAELGETLSALRLCEPSAVEAMSASLVRYGQLTPLIVFDGGGGLEVLDGFKRLRAARRLGWSELGARHSGTDPVEAKIQLAALHMGRSLTELEEGWLVRSLYREDHLCQAAIAERLGRHKSWVCRRLLLVEALEPEVQAGVRLGLLAARAAVLLASLPRGNQPAAMGVVTRRALTVRQTELMVTELAGCDGDPARAALLAKWSSGEATANPGPRPTRVTRKEADWVAADIATVHQASARLEARLLASPLRVFGATAAELLASSLAALVPVLAALERTIASVTAPQNRAAPGQERSAS